MIHWFKLIHKALSFRKKLEHLPEFWKAYETQFSEKRPADLQSSRFVVFDTETTGMSYKKDRVLCIGAVKIVDGEINVPNTLEIYIKQEHFDEESVPIHGIIKNENTEQLSELEAIERFLNYIGNAVLVAHHAKFDLTMINRMLRRHNLPKLKNRVLDTVNLYSATQIKSNLINKDFSLDKIAENYVLDTADRHTAAGDAFLTAIVFLKTTSILSKNKQMTLKKLFRV